MNPGEIIPGLNIGKNTDPIVVKERPEYPDYIKDLCKPPKSLAKLRKMPEEEADLNDMKRYLKLTRRLKIKDHNSMAQKK